MRRTALPARARCTPPARSASPLQRRLCDIHALDQHVAFKGDVFTMAGAVLMGQPADLTFL